MNHLTLHHLTQADREREISDDLRNQQILQSAAQARPEPTHPAATVNRSVTTSPRPATIGARATGR